MARQSGYDPTTGEWNDSLTGDYLWSNCNLAEAVPDVMTPLTWSMWQVFHMGTALTATEHPSPGNICGRPYANVSLAVALYAALGKDVQEMLEEMEGVIGRIPPEATIPPVEISRLPFLLGLVPAIVGRRLRARQMVEKMPTYIAASPERCTSLRQQIDQAKTRAALAALWDQELLPQYFEACWMLRFSARISVAQSSTLHSELAIMVGEADANALLLHRDHTAAPDEQADLLDSLGPMVGVARVVRGQMSRQEYMRAYGHRGPQECELMAPRPVEDAEWFDDQVTQFEQAPVDVDVLLADRRAEYDSAWHRFQGRYPRKVRATQRRLERVVEAARAREAVRSEITRAFGVIRSFAVRAGELTGLGDGVFFLDRDELLDVLVGDNGAVGYIAARRQTHARYSALPPYPGLINGRFDPFEWAADPRRRSDYYDAHAAPLAGPNSNVISGFAGAAGVVEGLVRLLDGPEQGDQLQQGEVLVAVTTNVGWTPLFPRAAAVVTDVGAPLSHAAIVARELGIPAVVGCGSATNRLRSGDRVRVDGGRGIVELLQ